MQNRRRPNVVGYIPNLLYKIYLNLKEQFDPKSPASKEEQICHEICLKLIEKEACKLTLAPVSLKRFIIYDEKQMFVVIENRFISIINHVYSYSVYMDNDELYDTIIDKFDQTLEDRRVSLELEIRNNIQHSLNSILENIKQTPSKLS